MNLQKGDVVTLDDDKDYMVMESSIYETNNYVLLSIEQGKKGVAFCQLINDNEKSKLIVVRDEQLIIKLSNHFMNLMQEDLAPVIDNYLNKLNS